jgi:hypothetical protein
VGTLGDLRTALAFDLAPMDVTVYPAWPTELSPPCVFITPALGRPFIEAGPNFREFIVTYDLVILVDHADPGAALAQLEDLVAVAVHHTADWAMLGIESPAPTTISEGGAEYLAVIVHLGKPVQL